MIKRLLVLAILSMLPALTPTQEVSASPCNQGFNNPLTRVHWPCIFPVQIAGISIGSSSPLDADNPRSPICFCPSSFGIPLPGIRVNFWAPNRWIDTVENPGCMMPLGVDILGETGRLHGSTRNTHRQATTFAQTHYYIAPVWAMLGLFQDIPCLETQGFDVALISEVLPTYQNEVLGSIINPEAVLFGNPAALLACVADAGVSHTGGTIDTLFWCMGGWGLTYPLGGRSSSGDHVEANAAIAAKQIFTTGRLGLARESTRNGCGERLAPIWTKSLYKLQEMRPVKQSSCVNIGRTGLLWSSLKHPPNHDNYAWQVFEKVFCCVTP